MRVNKIKLILLAGLLAISLGSLVYLNSSTPDHSAPGLTSTQVDEINQQQIRLPDIHIMETLTRILRGSLPSS